MLKIAYSPIYKYKLPEGHRFPMMKYELLPEQLLYEGTISENSFFHPDALTEDIILDTHDAVYWKKLKDQDLSVKEIRKIGFPLSPELVIRGTHISQGTIDCAMYAQQYGVALNIAGGTHHAYAGHGEGFCLLNDIAIASNYLLKQKLATQILVVDLDVHQGNGTAKLFENNPNVFTFSMHGAKNYPNRKEKSDLDIGLPDKTEDDFFLKTLYYQLPKLIDQVQPDFIFYLSGVDVLATDKLGRLSMTISGAKERDRFVFDCCQKNDIPVAVSMGGGYSERLADIIEAHANTFRVAMDLYF
jgi:acetoin utilization deacetylase AcuC-like enzyme